MSFPVHDVLGYQCTFDRTVISIEHLTLLTVQFFLSLLTSCFCLEKGLIISDKFRQLYFINKFSTQNK